jgi:hypothetical protein
LPVRVTHTSVDSEEKPIEVKNGRRWKHVVSQHLGGCVIKSSYVFRDIPTIDPFLGASHRRWSPTATRFGHVDRLREPLLLLRW